MTLSVGVVSFPGSNCEADVIEAIGSVGGADADILWHGDSSIGGFDAVVIPGGFAHGDYLRPGAIARFSPVMAAISAFAAAGGPVLGICNGFQVLTEAGLLPGALQKNAGLKFICGPAELIVASTSSVLTRTATVGDVLTVPINHFEGNFTCSPETLAELEDNGQVVLKYANNPNGSAGDIAGIANRDGNVVGLMPHPERACHKLLGSVDGRVLLEGFVSNSFVPA